MVYGIDVTGDHTQPGDEIITCRKCGHFNVHQVSVDVYFRKEDANDGFHSFVRNSSLMNEYVTPDLLVGSDSDMCNNPSQRRNAVTIGFICEACGEISQLSIIQHKGTTHLEWDKQPIDAEFTKDILINKLKNY